MLNDGTVIKARILRKRMTESEKILWRELKTKKLGVKFRRQMPFVFEDYHFIVDFYCSEKKLIIEVDGEIHNDQEIKGYDKFREEVFKQDNYKIVRFKNEEVINNLEEVLIRIKSIIK